MRCIWMGEGLAKGSKAWFQSPEEVIPGTFHRPQGTQYLPCLGSRKTRKVVGRSHGFTIFRIFLPLAAVVELFKILVPVAHKHFTTK